MSKLIFAFVVVFVSAASAHFDYGQCASGHCVGTPAGCIDAKKCDVVVHYAKAGDKFKFDVEADFSATGDVEDKWVGVGLSFDGGRGMGNDAAVACFVDSVGVDHVDNYWNVLDPAFFSYPVADAQGGLSDTILEIEDQKIHCTFTRDAVTEIVTPVEASETIVIDLTSTPFFVMTAAGPIDTASNTIRRHNKAVLTEEAVDFTKL